MMIDIQSETLLSLSKAARQVPPAGVNIGTLYRWMLRGVRGVRLDTVLIGGKRFTSAQALNLFFERTTAAADGARAIVAQPARAENTLDAAEKRLDALGINGIANRIGEADSSRTGDARLDQSPHSRSPRKRRNAK